MVLRLKIRVVLLSVLSAMLHITSGDSYDVSDGACRSDRDCPLARGETCLWMFDGCTLGQCKCDPREQRFDGDSQTCQKVSKGGEWCTSDESCVKGMECYRSRCACKLGSQMTSDGRACMQRSHKLLGQTCQANVDSCWHKPDYKMSYESTREVKCIEGRCQCSDGRKRIGPTCSKWSIGESGCVKPYDCHGGALCLDGRCQCPSGYIPAADNSKCAKYGAITELPLGAECSEENGGSYCAGGLICYQCNGDSRHKCVRFALTGEEFQAAGSAHALQACVLRVLLIPYILVTVIGAVMSRHSWTIIA